jgi:hypothetical protein
MYWTLACEFTCPNCGEPQKGELQTHFMGDVGSCANYYNIGDEIPELQGITATLGPIDEGWPDDFIGTCFNCLGWIDFGAIIEDGKVMKVWPFKYHAP